MPENARHANEPIWIRRFDEGDARMADLLGGKGANLAEMTRLGLPVPPGFTITTEACRAHLANDAMPPGLEDELDEAIAWLEGEHGRRFGDPDHPLLVSVRSGARFSMPGMMDTVLNIGLGPVTRDGLARETGDERFAQDAWRRLLEMFGRVVLGVTSEAMAEAARPVLEQYGVTDASELPDADALSLLAKSHQHVIEAATGEAFPTDPKRQLRLAVTAVFRSWNGQRARDYRRLKGIADDLGTAVNIQAMVFGNTGPTSGTGVAFTRDPATGDPAPYGDFLVDAQGEDVVAGTRATQRLADLATTFPEQSEALLAHLDQLEHHYRDMCDVEFTIDRGTLWLLQTRVGQRSPRAAVRMAVDMATEGIIDTTEALRRVTEEQVELMTHSGFAADATFEVAATGLAVSPGAAVGRIAFSADDAVARAAEGQDVILVATETSPDDLHGIIAAVGLLTSRGGLVSHAAVVARGIGKPAVCGAIDVELDLAARTLTVGAQTRHEGDVISIDGANGTVVLGPVPLTAADVPVELDQLLGWADQHRRLRVLANADTPSDAVRARLAGAEGIGLCRTEHQFLGDRLPIIQRVILSENEQAQQDALDELHVVQLEDFVGILEAMDGLPVTVRLLDPPLHEFLPPVDELLVADAKGRLDADGQRLLHAARQWREQNPMLGVRGVRLGLLRPAIYRMQTRALAEAVVARLQAGGHPRLQIMVPLVSVPGELQHALDDIGEGLAELALASGRRLDIDLGAMVETPRAALLAGELATMATFLSLGTNDLTQLTFGFSRDDVEARMMPRYLEAGILADDPFATLDVVGVGELVRLAIERARAARPDVELGICGEHGGDPRSIAECHALGIDYVSCSPARIPGARLAAARAALDVTTASTH